MGNERKSVKKNFLKGGKLNKDNSVQSFEYRPQQREGYITQVGEVIEALGNGSFKVELENDMTVLATLAGKLRMNFIKIIVGDKVEIQISVYDITKGRITRRLNK